MCTAVKLFCFTGTGTLPGIVIQVHDSSSRGNNVFDQSEFLQLLDANDDDDIQVLGVMVLVAIVRRGEAM